MYTPIKNISSLSKGASQGLMPVMGANYRDFSRLLDTRSALHIENYWLHGSGRLVKRKGTTLNFDTTESNEIPVWESYQNDTEIVAYGTKVRAYDNATGTFTDIKTDFTDNGFDGARAGDYFFITSISDGLWRISQTISYAQSQTTGLGSTNKFILTGGSGVVNNGDTITGGTSGATATVVTPSGTLPGEYTLIVSDATAAFTHGESITGGTLSGAILSNINPFDDGQIITGQTSGATARIILDQDNGATGVLTLGNISGTFQNGETLIDEQAVPGRGTASTALTYAISQVSDAPKARYILYGDRRLLLYQLEQDVAGWAYSEADDGSNPPFTNWTVGSAFNDPGAGTFRNGERALTASLLGNIYFIGFSKGYHSFSIDQTEISGVSSKFDNPIQTKEGIGISLSKTTDIGVVVCGKFGIKLLVSLGQSNVPYSDQWETLTEQLGEEYFDDVDFSDGDIIYDEVRGYIYVSCAKGGATKNLILACKVTLPGIETDVKSGATSFFTGLNPYKFLEKNGEIYFTSSIDGETFHLFDGENDNGEEVYSQYYQELTFGTLTDTFNLDEFKCEGELSPASTITVSFDTFDENGYFEIARKSYTWTATNSYTGGGGWSSPWGSTGWGSGGASNGLVYDSTGATPGLRGLTRVRVRFESSDTADHVLATFSARASIIAPTRNVKLTEI